MSAAQQALAVLVVLGGFACQGRAPSMGDQASGADTSPPAGDVTGEGAGTSDVAPPDATAADADVEQSREDGKDSSANDDSTMPSGDTTAVHDVQGAQGGDASAGHDVQDTKGGDANDGGAPGEQDTSGSSAADGLAPGTLGDANSTPQDVGDIGGALPDADTAGATGDVVVDTSCGMSYGAQMATCCDKDGVCCLSTVWYCPCGWTKC